MPKWNEQTWKWDFSEIELARQKKLLQQLQTLAIKEGFTHLYDQGRFAPSIRLFVPGIEAKKEKKPQMEFLFHQNGSIGLHIFEPYKLAVKKYETVRFAFTNKLAFANQQTIPGREDENEDDEQGAAG